jgi:serine/threonine-protein kinase
VVRSTPAGARVLIDGRDAGRTPVTIREVANGTHTIRVARDGYGTEERRVVANAARPASPLNVQLARVPAPAAARPASQTAPAAARPPAKAAPTPASAAASSGAQTGALTIDSRPTGSNVFVDGQLIGTTPLSMTSVSAGEHTVRIERDGYRPWTTSVRVVGGTNNRVAGSLER